MVVELNAADLEDAIAEAGTVPLPPYIHGPSTIPSAIRRFCRSTGSAAAPTAGLHFTPDVVTGLRGEEIEIAESTSTSASTPSGRSPAQHRGPRDPHRVVLGSGGDGRGDQRPPGEGGSSRSAPPSSGHWRRWPIGDGTVKAGERRHSLFLTPGVKFQVVDRLVTNFHLPGTTLVVLVAAFMGDSWREAYERPRRGYRFLSFGDAMIAER